jgi:hypothetical protein
LAHYNQIKERELQSIADMSKGPTVSEACVDAAEVNDVVHEVLLKGSVSNPLSSSGKEKISFKEITEVSQCLGVVVRRVVNAVLPLQL